MMRTIIYARVSTEDQVEKYGLPSQLRACRHYATAHGLDVIAEITDEGISGTILDRPGLNRARKMVRDEQADVLLMLDADRLSRELSHLLILKPEIERHASLQFVTAKFEDSPSGRMFFSIRGVIAQYERELTRERTMRGKRERANAGLLVGGRTAYGYRYQDGKLTPDESRAAVVRSIYGWYLSGLSMREITLRLRSQAAPTWSGRAWGHSSVRRILTNETYAGVAYYGTHRREGTVLRLRGADERVSLVVPALIEREQWERVQGRIAGNHKTGGRPAQGYLLRGMLHCSCGRRMTADTRRGYRSYRCNGRDPLRFQTDACHCSANATKLDAAAWGAIVTALSNADELMGLLRQHERALRESAPESLEQLHSRARKLRRKEEVALSSMLDPDLAADRATLKAHYRTAQEERRRVEAEITQLERSNSVTESLESWLFETVALLQNDLRTMGNPNDQQEFARGIIGRADWDGQELKLACFFGGKLDTTSARCKQFPPLQFTLKTRVAA